MKKELVKPHTSSLWLKILKPNRPGICARNNRDLDLECQKIKIGRLVPVKPAAGANKKG
jgi:hypothetical protein